MALSDISVPQIILERLLLHLLLNINLFTPRSRVLLEKLIGFQIVKKIAEFLGT